MPVPAESEEGEFKERKVPSKLQWSRSEDAEGFTVVESEAGPVPETPEGKERRKKRSGRVQFLPIASVKCIPNDQSGAEPKHGERAESNPMRRLHPQRYIYQHGGWIIDRANQKWVHVPPHTPLPAPLAAALSAELRKTPSSAPLPHNPLM